MTTIACDGKTAVADSLRCCGTEKIGFPDLDVDTGLAPSYINSGS